MSIAWPRNLRVHPLSRWPGAFTPRREKSKFKANLDDTVEVLTREIKHLGGKNAAMQIAIAPEAFRLDGYPRATAKPEHPGIILTLDSKHGALSYPCDTYSTWQENLRAIALALEALRKVDRYGVTKHGEQYRGFLAITASPHRPFDTAESAESWLRAQIGADTDVPLPTVISRAKRNAHPDTGGSVDRFQLVNDAATLLAG